MNQHQTDLFGNVINENKSSEKKQEHPQHLWDQFVRLGDMIGSGLHNEPDGKWITKEYNKLAKILCPNTKDKTMLYDSEKIKKSRADAVRKIEELLSNPEISINGEAATSYYSNDKFLVTWIGNWKGIPSEYRIELSDMVYKMYSGYSAVYSCASLVHVKEFKGYQNVEMALIDVGMKLLSNRKEKIAWYNKYAIPYNEKIKAQKDGDNSADS